MKEMIINVPCEICKFSQCIVDLRPDGYMTISCVRCNTVIAAGYASSPWELLKSKE